MRAEDLAGAKIAVVVPAFRVATHIQDVIRGVPAWIETIVVVEDQSPDDTALKVERLGDPRVTLIRHATNQGVGGAMQSGIREALSRGADIVVKMDGDDQMDPAHLPRLIEPLIDGTADVTKGNRYHRPGSIDSMPFIRQVGNAGLTFLVKLASGYWGNFDPSNGYVALRREVLERMKLEELPKRYFFESGLLIELGMERAVVRDIAIDARYGNERSSLSVPKTLLEFPPKLCAGFVRRIFWRYFVYDFNAISVFLLFGTPLFLFGVGFGLWLWLSRAQAGEFTSAGLVMLAAMPVILGFQMLLQALVLDIQGTPKNPICPSLRQRERDRADDRSTPRAPTTLARPR